MGLHFQEQPRLFCPMAPHFLEQNLFCQVMAGGKLSPFLVSTDTAPHTGRPAEVASALT